MAKQVISLRLEPGLLEWVDGLAAARGVSRQVVLEQAIEAARLTRGGVPGLESASPRPSPAGREAKTEVGHDRAGAGPTAPPRAPAPTPTRVPGVKTARQIHDEQMLARQMRLNRVKK